MRDEGGRWQSDGRGEEEEAEGQRAPRPGWGPQGAEHTPLKGPGIVRRE